MPAPPQFWLEVVDGPQQGAQLGLREGDLVVGRSPRCFLTLADARVAPTHCGLRVRSNQVIVAPGGTIVETFVNGKRLTAAQLLRVGDVLLVGPYHLRLEATLEDGERHFRAGDTVGPYRILAELGAGGVGRVYEARDPHDQPVALKVLRLKDDWQPHYANHRRALFRREAAALRVLSHPNVVRTYGNGEHEGLPWIAMELLEGATLREKLSGGRLPVRDIERIMFQLCAAVAAVHEAGVIPRDLTPANGMLVDNEQRVCLADFGLAQPKGAPKLEELDPLDQTDAVRVGQQVDTPAYMPPEQTRGEDADMRSDVWSLGAMLYELLSARRPFAPGGSVREVLTGVVRDCPDELPSDIEPYLRSAVYRCLQKARNRRFPNALALVETLHDRRVVQLLPVVCVRCNARIFKFTDGQLLAVPTEGGRMVPVCGTCAAVVTPEQERCLVCETALEDLPPTGLARSATRLTTGGTTVLSIFDRALEVLDKCPYCNTPRLSGDVACRACGFSVRAYACGRVELEMVVGGWRVRCKHCHAEVLHPDEAYCPGCGLGFATGLFPDGTCFQDDVPPELARRLR
ncbi:MAG: protein kinase [Armatimonadetes bacterium]|nr:protein kinase [Armatimonadota bacterium]